MTVVIMNNFFKFFFLSPEFVGIMTMVRMTVVRMTVGRINVGTIFVGRMNVVTMSVVIMNMVIMWWTHFFRNSHRKIKR